MSVSVPPIPTPDEFKGRVALVTGGTDGLGRHLTLALASLGAEVFFCGTHSERGRAVEAKAGPRGHFVRCDLGKIDDCRALARAAGALKGHIDYVVNNAATDRRIAFVDATPEDYERFHAVNLRSYFFVTQAAVPFLEKGAGKAVVNVSTTNIVKGLEMFTVYNSSKAGITGFTRSLARELGPKGIRANIVMPGWIMTERQLQDYVTEADKKLLLEVQSLKHLLTEEHVTPATLFLLSEASRGISGQTLVVDGGREFTH